MIEISLPDLDATMALAAQIAPFLEAGDVVGLEGSLGGGKTTFARDLIGAMAAHYGADPVGEVPSPTFTLVQVYETGGTPVWHFDLYRITRAEDAYELNIEEAFEVEAACEWVFSGLAPLVSPMTEAKLREASIPGTYVLREEGP